MARTQVASDTRATDCDQLLIALVWSILPSARQARISDYNHEDNQLTDDDRQFVQYLEQRVYLYLAMLEEMFGPRDPRFAFGTIGRSTGDPQTHFPGGYHTNGGCVGGIEIGRRAWESPSCGLATWQVAHECVHLLDPDVRGTANVLEEGLATWFQDEKQFHDENVRCFIDGNTPHLENYETAKRLVAQCQPYIVPAVKTIRSTGARIQDITADILAEHLPRADRETIKNLCANFK